MTRPVVRPGTPDDAAAVAGIWRDGWRDGHLGLVPDALVAVRTDESFSTRAAQRVDDTTVAVVDAEVAGFVMVDDDEVEQVYVSSHHRGKGVADVSDSLKAATQESWFNEWSAMCEVELNQMQPSEYPLAAESRPEAGYVSTLMTPARVSPTCSSPRPSGRCARTGMRLRGWRSSTATPARDRSTSGQGGATTARSTTPPL